MRRPGPFADRRRARAPSETLSAAEEAARAAGVTRVGDVTELGGLGVPTFQAVRPRSRSLSVSQGKGLTRTAARIGALLEAVELEAAERFTASGAFEPITRLPPAARAIWSDGSRDPLAVRLDPDRPRRWTVGVDLATGLSAAVPHDLVDFDLTRTGAPDAWRSTVGLATGGTRDEALAAGLSELIEQDAQARLERSTPGERRALLLDLGSVGDPTCRALIENFRRHGHAIRAWDVGGWAGVPAYWCTIFPENGRSPGLGPIAGSGCHAVRGVALARALLEAAQSRATFVAGARDDIAVADFRNGQTRQRDLLLASLAFGPGPRAWDAAADQPAESAADELRALLAAARRLSPLPVFAVNLPDPHPALRVARMVAPGLLSPHRAGAGPGAPRPDPPTPEPPTPDPPPAIMRRRSRAPVLFAGPSLTPGNTPDGVELRAPAICGDLIALLGDPPPAVGLVDGCFEIAPTVWHKEVLALLAAGVRVLGGASLGAIRAAELTGDGMEGIGTVYALYAQNLVVRDDAVMLAHAPAELGWRPLTLSLVDAEAALLRLSMPPHERRTLQRIARTTHYGERTWALCLDRYAERAGVRASVNEAELAAAPSLKERDARALAAALLRPGSRPRTPPPPRTAYLRALTRSTRR